MSKVKFTAGRVEGFRSEAGKSQSFLWDTDAPGLGLRATSSNAKSYIFQAKLNGQAIRITIGDPKTWSIDDARAEARRLKVIIDGGKDPRQVKADALAAEQFVREAKAAEAAARDFQAKRETVTLGMAWLVYIEARRKKWGTWTLRDHENVVRRGGEPKKRGKGLTEPGPLASLLDVKLSDLSGKRIGEWLAAEAGKRPTQAALAFRLLSVFVNWCESQGDYAGLVPAGACKASQVRDEMPSKNAKQDDSLQREQLALWFRAVGEMGNPVQSAYLQTLLLTGARRRELAALRWEDVDFQWLKMTIRDKVEGERTIPLTPYVAHLLLALKAKNDAQPTVRWLRTLEKRNETWKPSEWVFSSKLAANGQLVDPTPGHKRALKAAGLPDVTLHGLRRSFGTLAEWTEAPAGVVAQIMGHKPSAIAEKHYRNRPIDLLRMWHVKIEGWILEQAGIEFKPEEKGLKVVAA
ncbi:tyrosine-type recombinase/integrase [Noviherbaspirillum sp. ST9]|uniref:tyrosine-type recombinase/integrase n=1 Tax=Noviherbaspirillum sp. ST9 TaxID=3401606 RepID=UPI003B589B9C